MQSCKSGRAIKKAVFDLLERDDFASKGNLLLELGPDKVICPLFSSLCSSQAKVRWHGIYGFGVVVPVLAEQNMEKARIVMRRCIWGLNDESGGIGWGAPEVMGEVMANHKGLAEEFHKVCLSYIYDNPHGPDNFLEYLPLRRGAFWGVARLAAARPELAVKGEAYLVDAFKAEQDAEILGLACLAAAALKLSAVKQDVQNLLSDSRSFDLFWNKKFQATNVAELAGQALSQLNL